METQLFHSFVYFHYICTRILPIVASSYQQCYLELIFLNYPYRGGGTGIQTSTRHLRNNRLFLKFLLFWYIEIWLRQITSAHVVPLWVRSIQFLWLSEHLLNQRNNKNIRKRCEECSKLAIKTPKRRHWRRSGVFLVDNEHNSYIFLVLGWKLNPNSINYSK